MRRFAPSRIVCLTEETVETLYLLGVQDCIVGVSGYAVRPPQVRREKPRVSAFTSADIPAILALEPDLVLAFSDLQAGDRGGPDPRRHCRACLQPAGLGGHPGHDPHLGALVGAPEKAEALAQSYEERLRTIAGRLADRPKPRVYFEEWDDPPISGIGNRDRRGTDVFGEFRYGAAARNRIVAPEAVIAAAPAIILASRCGKKVVPSRICQRPGWDAIPAVRDGRIVEIKSPLILQPGPGEIIPGAAGNCVSEHRGWAVHRERKACRRDG